LKPDVNVIRLRSEILATIFIDAMPQGIPKRWLNPPQNPRPTNLNAAPNRGSPFQIGPLATVTSAPSGRYRLNDTNFEARSATNYEALRGNVKSIAATPNGDYCQINYLLKPSDTKLQTF
jgi:hypothetical protein